MLCSCQAVAKQMLCSVDIAQHCALYIGGSYGARVRYSCVVTVVEHLGMYVWILWLLAIGWLSGDYLIDLIALLVTLFSWCATGTRIALLNGPFHLSSTKRTLSVGNTILYTSFPVLSGSRSAQLKILISIWVACASYWRRVLLPSKRGLPLPLAWFTTKITFLLLQPCV